MNYRHAYHAGNIHDVFKHSVLLLLLQAMQKKDKPFAVLETHAGVGAYDLHGVEAGKTNEWQQGVGKVWQTPVDAHTPLGQFLAVVQAENPDGQLRYYPGSPQIEQRTLRKDDRLILCELHPDDAQLLKRNFTGDKRIACHHTDGYQGLKAFIPPKEKRGLIHIDPPFEKPDEFTTLAENIVAAWQRFPTGVFAVWYPIKLQWQAEHFHRQLAKHGIKRVEAWEYLQRPATSADTLNGSGMLLINRPFGSDITLNTLGNQLTALMGGQYSMHTITGE